MLLSLFGYLTLLSSMGLLRLCESLILIPHNHNHNYYVLTTNHRNFMTKSLLLSRRPMCLSSESEKETDVVVVVDPAKKWDLKGLKEEVNRNYLRTFKKISKVSESINNNANNDELQQQQQQQQLLEKSSLQLRLSALKSLEERLKAVKSSGELLLSFPDLIQEAIRLDSIIIALILLLQQQQLLLLLIIIIITTTTIINIKFY